MLEWALPEDGDIGDMEAVKEANPASWLTSKVLAEQREAVHELAFRRYHANQWVQAEAPWIAASAWDACSARPEIPDGASDVVLGVDAAIPHDSSAVATVWRDEAGIFHATFEVWEPTAERDVELELVVEHIRKQCRRYRVSGVAFDPYFLWHAAQRLEAEGIAMVEWKQDNARMVPATQTLYEAIVHRRLRHGGHEVARAHALAAEVRETERGLRIRKSGRERNDAVVALAMAVEWASGQAEPRKSVYETRGLVTA
jgi:phage terminase large subunit-like protein